MTIYLLVSDVCPGCAHAKEKFKKEIASGEMKIIDLDRIDAGLIKNDMIRKANVKKVPSILACDEERCNIIW